VAAAKLLEPESLAAQIPSPLPSPCAGVAMAIPTLLQPSQEFNSTKCRTRPFIRLMFFS
jgi:hypothetical protein